MDEDTLIKQKEKSWRRYDYLLAKLNTPRKKKLSGELITEFCRLHREVCSDLSCAVSAQRSEGVIRYLHTLVGRGHAQLYRFEKVRIWGMRQILREMSARLYYDNCFRLALVIFYGSFAVSMLLGAIGDNFCAALDAPADRLRSDLDLLPTLAEDGLVAAGKHHFRAAPGQLLRGAKHDAGVATGDQNPFIHLRSLLCEAASLA